jgi:hypothetical protein
MVPRFSWPTARKATARKGVSDCLGRSSWLWCAPWYAVPEHGVEDDQQLAHGSGERELLGFAGGDQA